MYLPDWISAGRSWGRPCRIDRDRIPAIWCIVWLGGRRPEAIVILSILTPLPYRPNLSYRIGVHPIYCIPYRPGGVSNAADTYVEEYEVARSNLGPRGTNWAEYPVGRSGFRGQFLGRLSSP